MPRIDIETRRVVFLRRSGYSLAQINIRLQEEYIHISLQALYNLLKKYNNTGKLIGLPRRTCPRKLNEAMITFLNKALFENDELTATQAHSLLMEKWPTLQVSLPTIKRNRQQSEWVCTRPHYCQLIRDVSELYSGYIINYYNYPSCSSTKRRG